MHTLFLYANKGICKEDHQADLIRCPRTRPSERRPYNTIFTSKDPYLSGPMVQAFHRTGCVRHNDAHAGVDPRRCRRRPKAMPAQRGSEAARTWSSAHTHASRSRPCPWTPRTQHAAGRAPHACAAARRAPGSSCAGLRCLRPWAVASAESELEPRVVQCSPPASREGRTWRSGAGLLRAGSRRLHRQDRDQVACHRLPFGLNLNLNIKKKSCMFTAYIKITLTKFRSKSEKYIGKKKLRRE